MAKTLTYNLTDEQAACLLDTMLDIDEWHRLAIEGQVNHCKKMMLRAWEGSYLGGTNEADQIVKIFADANYKNRPLRDATDAATSAAFELAKAQDVADKAAAVLAAADPVDQKAIDAAQVADDEAQAKLVTAQEADTAAKAAIVAAGG